MNKTQLLALTSVTTALTAFITSLANGEEVTATTETAAAGEAPVKRRGRPPATEKPPETEQPAETVTGKTYEELQALIRPLVEAGSGAEVKAVIAKYGENLKAVAGKPETHASFEKDITALSY